MERRVDWNEHVGIWLARYCEKDTEFDSAIGKETPRMDLRGERVAVGYLVERKDHQHEGRINHFGGRGRWSG